MTGKYPWLVLPDKYKDICRSAVHSYDPLQQDIFTTPWAVHYEDELFFNKTVTLLGDIIKDDVKLGTLFMILILSTPGSCLSAEARADPSLNRVQSDTSLLMYRYLKDKLGNPEDASHVINCLLKLIPDLHESSNIHILRRISL